MFDCTMPHEGIASLKRRNGITTTLEAVREKRPCTPGWTTLLKSLNKTKADTDALPLEHILDSNDFDDALWALRALDEKYDPALRLFAVFCVKHCLDNFEEYAPKDKRPRNAIKAVEDFLAGKISKEEMQKAGYAAWSAAESAAWSAARSAARSAAWSAARSAAESAAWSAAESAAVVAMKQEFRRMCRLEGEYGKLVCPAETHIEEGDIDKTIAALINGFPFLVIKYEAGNREKQIIVAPQDRYGKLVKTFSPTEEITGQTVRDVVKEYLAIRIENMAV